MSLVRYDMKEVLSSKPDPNGWLGLFYKYLGQVTIDSKEEGVVPLRPYSSQRLILYETARGLSEGIHSFTWLKSRQLGVTTILTPIDLFWMTLYPGTQGAFVSDDEINREQYRKNVDRTLLGLPPEYKVGVKRHYRDAIELKNGSFMRFIVAGTRKKGAMGVGGGYSLVHATECSRYGDPEAWSSFLAALAERNPHRLFVYESTARGFNLFKSMWEDAIESPEQRALFVGWWAKRINRLKRGTKLYHHYYDGELTPEEREKIGIVKDNYGVEITDEQVAWYRMTTRKLDSDAGYVAQEHPWHAEEAFLMTGKMFFPSKHLTFAMHRAARSSTSPGIPFKGYFYELGERFETTRIEIAKTVRQATLRIWEEPDPFGVYAVGADPAYGDSVEGNTWRDRFAIQILRCYADRVVQVAEFADDDMAPHQFAWVLAHLCGYYRNVKVCLEINGPGTAVTLELKHLKDAMANRPAEQRKQNPELDKIFDHWSWYLYHRLDSLAGGYMLHFQSTGKLKNDIMLRMKDNLMLGKLDIRSVPLLEEMKEVVSKDGWVGAEGRGKDDRTLAFALAHRAYDELISRELVMANRTYENEVKAEENRKASSRAPEVMRLIVTDFFRTQDQRRAHQETVDAEQALYG